jgi:hypothetical protein
VKRLIAALTGRLPPRAARRSQYSPPVRTIVPARRFTWISSPGLSTWLTDKLGQS